MEVGQRRTQDVKEGGQVGDAEPPSGPQHDIEPCTINEVHDDSRSLLGQRHHLPHGHQTGVTQHTQISQPSQDARPTTPTRQVDDPDDDMAPLCVQPTTRRAGDGRAPHHLTDGVSLLSQGPQRRGRNTGLGIGDRSSEGTWSAGDTAPRHWTACRPGTTVTTDIADMTIGRPFTMTGAHR